MKVLFISAALIFSSYILNAQDSLKIYLPFTNGDIKDSLNNSFASFLFSPGFTKDRFNNPNSALNRSIIKYDAFKFSKKIADFTISYWFYPSSDLGTGDISIEYRVPDPNHYSIVRLLLSAFPNISIGSYRNSDVQILSTGKKNSFVKINDWSNVVFLFSIDTTTTNNTTQGTCSVFLNKDKIWDTTFTSYPFREIDALFIGSTANPPETFSSFNFIDDFKFFKKRLNIEEINKIFGNYSAPKPPPPPPPIVTGLAPPNNDELKPVSISPNPVQNEFIINGLMTQSLYKIVDMWGREAKYGKIANSQTINVSDLTRGLYIIRISDMAQKPQFVLKMIKI